MTPRVVSKDAHVVLAQQAESAKDSTESRVDVDHRGQLWVNRRTGRGVRRRHKRRCRLWSVVYNNSDSVAA